MKERTKKFIARGIKTALVAPILYLGTLFSLELIPEFYSQRVHNQGELEEVCKEEIRNFNKNSSREIIPLFVNYEEASSEIVGKNKYEIKVGGLGVSRNTIRHELYHILGGHLDSKSHKKSLAIGNKKDFGPMYWLYFEPSAALYAATGIKI